MKLDRMAWPEVERLGDGDTALPELPGHKRRGIWMAAAETLAALHQVDFQAVGLEDYGRVGGYMGRQVARWSKQYEASKTDELPEMDKLMVWLPEVILLVVLVWVFSFFRDPARACPPAPRRWRR